MEMRKSYEEVVKEANKIISEQKVKIEDYEKQNSYLLYHIELLQKTATIKDEYIKSLEKLSDIKKIQGA